MTEPVSGDNEQTPALPDQQLILRAICDPGSFTKRGDYHGEPYGEGVQHWSMRAVQQVIAERLGARVASQDQWFVFYGGPDPDNAAGLELRDDEDDAREHVRWLSAAEGAGIARRSVYYGPWEIVEFASDRLASESSGDGSDE